MSDGIEVDSREVGKVSGLLTGKKYQIKVKTKFSYHIVEMEDVHFHFDSAVLYLIINPVPQINKNQTRNI